MRPELPTLIKARALIADPSNWGKGRRGHERSLDTCCAAEAIEEIGLNSPARQAAYRAIERAAGLVRITENLGSLIVDWNDDPDTTHAEVLAAFDKAIAEAA